jgi:hypothetical protein
MINIHSGPLWCTEKSERKNRMVIFISNLFSSFQCFGGLAWSQLNNNILILLGLNTVQMKIKAKGHKEQILANLIAENSVEIHYDY